MNGKGIMKYIELFGGMGAQTYSLRKYGKHNWECVKYVENDYKAAEVYSKLNLKPAVVKDIISWTPKYSDNINWLHASPPCQAFSVQGLGKGADDERGAPLWQATIEKIKFYNPQIITIENVKGLLSNKHKELFNWFIDQLEQYNLHWKVYDASEYGSCQKRERVWIIGVRKDIFKSSERLYQITNYLETHKDKQRVINDVIDIWKGDIYNIEIDKRYKDICGLNELSAYHNYAITFDKQKLKKDNQFQIVKCGELVDCAYNLSKWFYSPYGQCGTLLAKKWTCFDHKIAWVDKELLHYRELTTKDMFLIQGFKEEDWENVKDLKETRLCKAIGNSIDISFMKTLVEAIEYSYDI